MYVKGVFLVKVKVVNSSSRKTRDKIKKSFALLMSEKKDLNKITVTALVSKADITRSAFYTHYDNIYDVAREIHDEMLEVLVSNIDNLQTLENIDKYFDQLFLYLKGNEEIYSMILSSNSPLLFTDNLCNIISKNLIESLDSYNKDYLELRLTLFINGCIYLLIRYFRNEINYSLDDINTNIKDTFKTLFLNK